MTSLVVLALLAERVQAAELERILGFAQEALPRHAVLRGPQEHRYALEQAESRLSVGVRRLEPEQEQIAAVVLQRKRLRPAAEG